MSPTPPRDTAPILVFDVNETLLDIRSLEPLFDRLFGDASVMRDWFAQLVLHSQAMTLAGRYAPFGALGGGTLRMVGRIRDRAVTDDDVAELAARIGSMPPMTTPPRRCRACRKRGSGW